MREFNRISAGVLTFAVLLITTLAGLGTVIVMITRILYTPSVANMCVPVTANAPPLPVTVPRLERPLPQLIVATKRAAGVEVFASVKVATGPRKDFPRTRSGSATDRRGCRAAYL